jgi:amino acid adenylation domain-containing protein
MNTIEFVNHLRRLDINLFLEGKRLRCNAPEGTLTPDLKSEISSRKAEIISFLHQVNNQTNASAIAPISRTENNTFPLSFAQQRLWFLNQLQPNSAFYNIPLNLHFSGQLNIAALESSLQLLISRHEILRTNFIAVDGEPVQAIAATRDFTLPIVDLRPLSASERELEYEKLASVAAMYVFNLAQEPLLRAQLVQLTPTENVLLLTVHHIIFDGWSVNIFVQELTTVYSALVEHHAPNLPEIHLQYVDFAVWQQQWLQGEVLQSQLAYWQQKLAGMPALLELPADRPRRAVQSFCGETQVFTLEQDISEALVSLSQQQGVTLFMLLLTAFKVLLYRYTNQSDIVVGTPVANRQHSQIQGMIGFFVNNLVLRADLSDNPTFLQLLKQVREVVLEAYEHQNVPFEKLVEALHPERNLSYTPLFQIYFVLEHEPRSTVTLKDVTINTSEPGANQTAKFDLSLSLQKTEQDLTGAFEYSTDLFDATTIARMIEHWQILLAGIVANPEQRLSDLPILTAIEQHKLLVEWNQTQQDYPQNLCIYQLFEAQVEQTPDAVAVIFKDEQLTYRELNAKANQLAHHLQTLGVKPETLVGICVERSLEMIVGLLGILKAGGAYVPIDPAYPSERIAHMLFDSRLPVLLTQQKLVASLPEHQARVVCLDADWEEISVMPELPLITGVTPENLAYVIYTSGSTGKPKGVLIAHRGLCNLATAQIKLFDVQNNSCVLQFASLSFDVSVGEIVMALCAGATLCLGTRDELQPGQPLLKLLQKQKITHMGMTPSALAALPTQELPALETIIAWGEPCPPNLVAQWASGRRFFNGYGPTESTVIATVFQGFEGMDVLPIGRPIDNTLLYILDRYLQPVPIGVPGELHIASVGLARGYLNCPDLTEEKFIPNPFSIEPGEYLYKTGDKARYLPDGNIEFLGRIDNQVKIRGFRIELGEVEAALASHPAIRETVVVAREDTPGNKRLVAYVVPKGEAVQETVLPTINELRSFLKTKLPDYMVPGAFVFLETMPLTPNGKIDRRALPAPDSSLRELENNFVAPSTPTEETLAAIWAEVLGLQQVGIHDNFFELGGHSLLATSVISRIQEAFKIELPLRHLFEAPTIASLSQVIETVRQAGFIEQSSSSMTQDVLPPLVPTARDTHIPLSRAQEYIWYVQQLNPDSCKCNSGVPLRFNGLLSPEVVEKSINEIIRRHEILRTTFTVKEGQPVQVIAPSLTLPLKIVNLQDLPAAEREASAQRIVAEEWKHHFDLANGPLIKTTLLRLAPLEHWLLIPMHHIITDGWSIGIFLQELETLISAFSTGEPSSKGAEALTALPSVPLQYADFTFWERKRLNEEVLEKQLSYWLQKLANSPQPQDVLPSEQLRPTTNSRQASFFSLVLPESLVASISALSRTHGVTTFAIIITALKILLFKWSGQTEILVVATTGNRSTPESERILGCFINDVILRSLLSDSQTGLTLLEQVKETVNEAINHKEVPLQKVIEAVSSKRELALRASVTMEPPIQGIDGMSKWEIVPVPPKCELWDEEIPLELYVSSPTEDSQTIEIEGYCSTELFTNETIERLCSYYQEILQKLVQHPEMKLSEFEWAKDN